jgi:hypothetical protein
MQLTGWFLDILPDPEDSPALWLLDDSGDRRRQPGSYWKIQNKSGQYGKMDAIHTAARKAVIRADGCKIRDMIHLFVPDQARSYVCH